MDRSIDGHATTCGFKKRRTKTEMYPVTEVKTNPNAAPELAIASSFSFPIGYYDLHSDISVNFQLNRIYGWVGDVSDAVRFYRLVLENGQAGARCHTVAEKGIALREIAEVIGEGLKMAVESITPEKAPEYFRRLAELAQIDLAASGPLTRQQLGWNRTGPDLLTDLRNMDYSLA